MRKLIGMSTIAMTLAVTPALAAAASPSQQESHSQTSEPLLLDDGASAMAQTERGGLFSDVTGTIVAGVSVGLIIAGIVGIATQRTHSVSP